MKEQLALQNLIRIKYEEIRAKNPQFSRRAFSKRLGVSAGAMSELFNGRRQVSRLLAEKIATRLALDPQERSELLRHFPAKRADSVDAENSQTHPRDYLRLSTDQFRVIADWQHFAILSLMRTSEFQSDPQWIADRLGLPLNETKASIQRLMRLEMIGVSADGKWTRQPQRYRTSDDVASSSIRLAHSQYLNKAREALETLPPLERDFTSLMLTMKPSQLMRAKEMIRKFQDELSAELEAEPAAEVFQLCIQLFPLTKQEKTNDFSTDLSGAENE